MSSVSQQRRALFERLGSRDLVAVFAFSAVGILISLCVAVFVVFNRREAHVQDDEEFAVVWRNAQRARSELLGLWFFRSFSNLRKLIVTARQIITQWERRVRVRNELITLSDGDLRDIGWTKAEVEAERRKPFWRA
jgi:uncharacterized protein YjiS (DUF1127 family)